MSKPTVVLMPDGVSLRTFVLGGALSRVCARGGTGVLHPAPESLVPLYQREAPGASWTPLPPAQDNALVFTLRNAVNAAHGAWAGTFASRYRPRRPQPWRRAGALAAARTLGRLSASPAGIRRLSRLHETAAARLPEVRWYRDLFSRSKPGLVFSAKQLSLRTVPPILAARALGIPTAAFIFSWDNLTAKGHIPAPFDHYLVWSEHMRLELLHYYPSVPPSAVHVVGSPQFDPYAREDLLWSRDEFFRRIRADRGRPLICYSGGDAGTCPEDPAHVRILLDLVRSGAIRGNPQIALRPMPVDDGSRYAALRREYPELLVIKPAWVHKGRSWEDVMPLPQDVRLLANLVHHAALNINVASTMTLDFALNDRPVVNIAFDVSSPPPHGRPLWHHYYQYDHYRPVIDLHAARIARSPEELAAHVNAYLEDPGLDREGRRRLVSMQLRAPFGLASDRVADVLERIGA
jgi:hypothetical protein